MKQYKYPIDDRSLASTKKTILKSPNNHLIMNAFDMWRVIKSTHIIELEMET